MKFKEITFSESIESVNSMGLHRWRKFDAVVELDENDNEDVCALNVAAKVGNWHSQSNPGSQISVNPDYQNLQVNNPDYSPPSTPEETGLRNILHVATTKKNLELFRKKFYDTKDEKLIEEFESKLNQLP